MSKKNKNKEMNSAFAKFRSMIWVNCLTLVIILITITITTSFVRELFFEYRIGTLVLLSIFIFVYNFGFFCMYKMAKHFIMYNMISFCLLLISGVMVAFFTNSAYASQKIIFIVGLLLSTVPLLLSSIVSFFRVKEIYKYIAYNETLYDLEARKFKKNNVEIKIKLFLKPGHFYIEENGVRRKFASSNVSNLKYRCATIFQRIGEISFVINKDLYEYKYSSAFEDGIMFSLAYNIARINSKATLIKEKGDRDDE